VAGRASILVGGCELTHLSVKLVDYLLLCASPAMETRELVMRVRKFAVAVLFAASGVAAGIMAAPIAVADTCDPAVTICQGGDIQTNTSSPDYSPPVSAADDQYPFDSDWYFNPAGGGTALQPDHPSTGGGGSGGGGGGHR
jgi:hypothetical protein